MGTTYTLVIGKSYSMIPLNYGSFPPKLNLNLPNRSLTKFPQPLLPIHILPQLRQLLRLTLHKPIRPRPSRHPILPTYIFLLDALTSRKKSLRFRRIFVRVENRHEPPDEILSIPGTYKIEAASTKIR